MLGASTKTGSQSRLLTVSLFDVTRWLLGVQYVANGINWWFKILPFPSQVDLPLLFYKHEILRPMIESGWMFDTTKLVEVLAGIALLSNRWVPLMMVMSMPIALMTFALDAQSLVISFTSPANLTVSNLAPALLDTIYFGGAVLGMQVFVMSFLLDSYLPMLAMRTGSPTQPVTPINAGEPSNFLVTEEVAPPHLHRPSVALGWVALLLGITSTAWLVLMIDEWAVPWTSLVILAAPTP